MQMVIGRSRRFHLSQIVCIENKSFSERRTKMVFSRQTSEEKSKTYIIKRLKMAMSLMKWESMIHFLLLVKNEILLHLFLLSGMVESPHQIFDTL